MSKKQIWKELKFFLIRHFLGLPIHFFLKFYFQTLQFKIENVQDILSCIRNGGRIVIAVWHQRIFAGFYVPKIIGRPMSIMISKSRDGDLIADAVERIGWTATRGSGSRRGREALRELVTIARSMQLSVHVVDGPTGPATIIKPGLMTLAREADAFIMPVYVSYEKPITFNSWDRFMIPKPFTRVLLRFGRLENLNREGDAASDETYRKKIENEMREEHRKLDAAWDSERFREGFKCIRGARKEILRDSDG